MTIELNKGTTKTTPYKIIHHYENDNSKFALSVDGVEIEINVLSVYYTECCTLVKTMESSVL